MYNLQESIRRILKEETDHLRMMLRRLPSKTVKKMDEEFDSSLNYISKMFIKTYKSDPRKLSEHEFTRMVIIDLMSLLDVRNHLPNDVEWYDDVLNSLSKHYKKRITSMYNEIRGINESIIREESNKDILIDGLYDPIYEENGIVLFKEPKHLKVYSKFGIKKSNVISGKEFNKKYVDFKNKKLHKVLYKDGMTLGGNLGEGKYWCSTEYCLSVYLGETHQSSEYSKYVKEVVDFKLGDDLKILVKKHISDDL